MDWLEGLSDHKYREFVLDDHDEDLQPITISYFDRELEVLSGPDNTPIPHRRVLLGKSWYNAITAGKDGSYLMYKVASSVMAPTIMIGDDVLVSVSEHFDNDNGSVWLFYYGDKYLIQRIQRRPTGTLQISGDNPTTPVVEVATDEIGLIGKVIWQGRRLTHS
ncbi:S24 family peptidase [Sphingomonas sp. LB2R24]|uniref:S24 family peptidase n=1 Tax=Sphingomonas sorbitolis TaxID=3096165 RepID=UPI002FCC2606